MLSTHLLALLRAYWKAARPQGWLFPGRDRVTPLSTRQLNRACHAAAQAAGIDKRASLHNGLVDYTIGDRSRNGVKWDMPTSCEIGPLRLDAEASDSARAGQRT